MSALSPAGEARLEEARRVAALSGPFPPDLVLPRRGELALDEAVRLASMLASACDTAPLAADGHWLLRGAERRYVVSRLIAAGALEDAIRQRRESDPDAATRDLLDALTGSGDFAPAAVEALVKAGQPREALERAIVSLDRAGEPAPAHPHLAAARAALARLEREERWALLSERGFFGRRAELKRVEAWLSRPVATPPAQCLFVTGLAGVGKSSLLEQAARRAFRRRRAIVVRMDFERGGLDVRDVLGLTMELARQVADRLGEAGKPLLDARLKAANVTSLPFGPEDSARMLLPLGLAEAIVGCVRRARRPVCFLFDTMEQLRARGESHTGALFEWIDRLQGQGLPPFWVIAAGRGDAFDSAPERVQDRVELKGLDDRSIRKLLDSLGVAGEAVARIRRVAGDHPLALRLAAEAAAGEAELDLPDDQALGRAVARGMLYRTLIARIEDVSLREIIHGLIVPRLDAQLIGEVIAPAVGLGPMAPDDAERLFRRLARIQWLVEREGENGGFLCQRADLRAYLLPLLYVDEAEQCLAINEAAAQWYAARSDPAAAVAALYHRLQLMRGGGEPPEVDPEAALQMDDVLVGELPEAARNLVLAARGERTGEARASPGSPPPAADSSLAAELLAITVRRDWSEGRHFVAALRRRGDVARSREIADAVLVFCWRSGSWADAVRLAAGADGPPSLPAGEAGMPAAVALARLEIAAEADPVAFTAKVRAGLPVDASARRAAAPTSDGLASQGAFAFLARAPDTEAASSTRLSVVEAAFERFGGATARGYAAAAREAALALLTERMKRVPVLAGGPAADGETLAVLNPYAAPLAALATAPDKGWIIEAARRTDARLSRARPAPLAAQPDDPVAGITQLGLFAEWVSELSAARRDPDLELLAASAERWRRTVAGRWSYGGPPSGWDILDCDPVTAARLALLGEEGRRGAPRWLRLWGEANTADAVRAELFRAWGSRPLAVAAAEPLDWVGK
ncbi:MAG: ATP-binding protein [Alphaproteobacteria bacterium]|nr:ATP-binding protein [Alphaproteobacteria bacterium]MBV9371431.1 ATP-binding protein [Alphaproteobacteria bacterium]MBV9902368.1 ATP-binding protein [Alphaproteobacteria bacterium]